MKKAFVLLTLVCFATLAFALTADEIVDRMERNVMASGGEFRGTLSVSDRFGTRRMGFHIMAQDDNMLLEFTNPEDAGKKILRTADEIFLYFPDAEEVVRLQGSALRDSMMGSDISYEDMTGGADLRSEYTVALTRTETLDGNECYVLTLDARSRGAAYPRRVIWVDTTLFVTRKIELYSTNNRLLKTIEILDYIRSGNSLIPSRELVRDQLRRGSQTEMVIESAEVGRRFEASVFSRENLSW